MSHTSNKITAPVNIQDDLGYMLGTGSGDLATNIKEGSINAYAKWHPVISSSLDLNTVLDRRRAGRSTLTDSSMQYGLKSNGVGYEITSLASIHTGGTFTYTRPTAGSPTQQFRSLDFAHPEVAYRTTYGYRHDAYFDMTGHINWTSQTGYIIEGLTDGIRATITCDPHLYSGNNTRRNEMISINDFLENDEGTLSHDVTTCYACVLISQGSYHFVHGLIKNGQSSVGTIGRVTETEFNLSTLDLPADLQAGSCTVSFFIVSQKRLVAADTSTNIDNWVRFGTGDHPIFAAWLCPIPNACGYSATISTSAVPTKATATAIANVTTTGFTVNYKFDNKYTGAVSVAIAITVGAASCTKTQTFPRGVDPVLTNSMAVTYSGDLNGQFVPISGQTYTVSVTITTTVGTASESTTSTLTFTAA